MSSETLKVSEMTEATEVKNTDVLMIVQEGINKKIKVEKIQPKINELTEATVINETDLLLVEQEGINKKVKKEKIQPKISEMTETTQINDEDLLIVEQKGRNKKVKIDKLQKGGKVLYSNTTGTTGNITLSDSVENYKYIEIRYKGINEEEYSTNKITTKSLSRIHLNSFFITIGGLLNVANGRIGISANTLTWTNNRTIIDGQYDESGNKIKIIEVVGYK